MTPSNTSSNSSSYGLLLVGTVTATSVCVGYLVYQKERGRARFPIGPPPHWLFGNLFDGSLPNPSKGETFDKVQLEIAKKHGLVFRLDHRPLMPEHILISDPTIAKKVFVQQHHNCPKSNIYKELAPCLGKKSIITLPGGKEWSDIRKRFNPGFTHEFLKGMLDTMALKLGRYIETLEQEADSGKAIHFLDRTQMYTSDVILAVAFGEEWDKQEKHPARLYEDRVVELFAEMILSPLKFLFGVSIRREMNHYGKLVDREMRAILERRLAAPPEEKSKDILSLAVKHMLKEDGPLTEEDKAIIADQLKSFYFAGHDTVGATITWATWLLSQYTNVLEKVRQELHSLGIWTDPNVAPTFEQLQKCNYLQAVIHETLRLYPPATGLSRKGMDLKGIYFKGYEVKAPVVTVNVYVMHHHPDLWEEPEVFRPERFLDGSEGPDLQSKFIPFSRGPRDCIGKHFAILEAKLALSKLVTKFDFECIDPNEVFDYKMTNLPKNGCQLKVLSRDHS